MRRTRWTIAAAMVLLALGVTRPVSVEESEIDTALDFTGIERLRFETNLRVDIEIGGRVPALTFDGGREVDVVVERDGDTLHVSATLPDAGYYSGTLVVPARLQHFDIHGQVNIEAKRPVHDLRITTDHPLDWKGDAGRLEIVRSHAETHTDAASAADGEAAAEAAAAAAAMDFDYCECGGVVNVDGAIDRLYVRADTGKVYVDRSLGHGQVTLDLAQGVTFDLENAVDLEGVTLIRRPAANHDEPTDPETMTQ